MVRRMSGTPETIGASAEHAPPSPPGEWTEGAALSEFRPQATLGVALAAIVLGLTYDLATALGGQRTGAPLTVAGAGSFAVGLATLLLLRVSVHAAVAVLSGGMAAVVAAAAVQRPDYPVLTGLAPIVALLGVLFGWPGGLLGAVAASGVVATLTVGPSAGVPVPASQAALGLIWISALLGWLATRPIALALAWSWSSYQQALRTTELLRDRQAELTRLNRSLNDAYGRLEEANHELERARRAAVRARRLRDRFAATVSHEMRTPLNIIAGFSEAMVGTPEAYYGARLPSSYAADVAAIHRNASHLSQLVDDILDLAQIEAEQLSLRKEVTRVDQLLGEATALVAGLFQAKGLALDVEAPADLPGRERRPAAHPADPDQPALQRGPVHRRGWHPGPSPGGGAGRRDRGPRHGRGHPARVPAPRLRGVRPGRRRRSRPGRRRGHRARSDDQQAPGRAARRQPVGPRARRARGAPSR